MFSLRRWTHAWIAGLLLLPVACKQELTDPGFSSSSGDKEPVGHPGLGIESKSLAGTPFAVAINKGGAYYVTTVFGLGPKATACTGLRWINV